MDTAKIMQEGYKRHFQKGDKLGRVANLVNWESFRPILEPLFANTGEGRPHIDVVLMTKVLVLQSWYGISDEQLEHDCNDRLTFMNFLGYPRKVPDARTIWLFKERIAAAGAEKKIWDQLQRQLTGLRIAVRKGKATDAVLIELGGWQPQQGQRHTVEVAPHAVHSQDSTIIEKDPGAPTEQDVQRLNTIRSKSPPKKGAVLCQSSVSEHSPRSKRTKPRGSEARTTRSRDGSWTKKHNRSYFGYKLHISSDLASGLIEDLEVTTASVHDSSVDLTRPGEVYVRDRGYHSGRGLCVDMIRATRTQPLEEEDVELNRFLARVRAPVEHPFSVIKRIFHAGRAFATTVRRIRVRMTFVCTCYNIWRLLCKTGRQT